MLPSRLAVIAFPHAYATAIAHVLRSGGRHAVEVPDLLAGDWEPTGRIDVVITSLPVPTSWARVIITLPGDFADGVLVTVGGRAVSVDVGTSSPLLGLRALVDQVTADPSPNPGGAMLGTGGDRPAPSP